jgi:hypothetical protein
VPEDDQGKGTAGASGGRVGTILAGWRPQRGVAYVRDQRAGDGLAVGQLYRARVVNQPQNGEPGREPSRRSQGGRDPCVPILTARDRDPRTRPRAWGGRSLRDQNGDLTADDDEDRERERALAPQSPSAPG